MLDFGATTFLGGFLISRGRRDAGAHLMRPVARLEEGRTSTAIFGAYCQPLGSRYTLCHGLGERSDGFAQRARARRHPRCGTRLRQGPQQYLQLGSLKWAGTTYPTPKGVIKIRHEKQADASGDQRATYQKRLRAIVRSKTTPTFFTKSKTARPSSPPSSPSYLCQSRTRPANLVSNGWLHRSASRRGRAALMAAGGKGSRKTWLQAKAYRCLWPAARAIGQGRRRFVGRKRSRQSGAKHQYARRALRSGQRAFGKFAWGREQCGAAVGAGDVDHGIARAPEDWKAQWISFRTNRRCRPIAKISCCRRRSIIGKKFTAGKEVKRAMLTARRAGDCRCGSGGGDAYFQARVGGLSPARAIRLHDVTSSLRPAKTILARS